HWHRNGNGQTSRRPQSSNQPSSPLNRNAATLPDRNKWSRQRKRSGSSAYWASFSPSGRPSIRDGWLISERKIAALPKRQRFGESVEFSGPFLKKEVSSFIWGRQNEANITKLYSLRNVPVHLLDQVGSYAPLSTTASSHWRYGVTNAGDAFGIPGD